MSDNTDARIAELETELRAYKKERFDRERISSEIDDMNPSKDYRAGFHEGFLNGDWQRMHMRVRIAKLEAALKPFADAADHFKPDSNSDIFAAANGHKLYYSDLLNARAALKGEK